MEKTQAQEGNILSPNILLLLLPPQCGSGAEPMAGIHAGLRFNPERRLARLFEQKLDVRGHYYPG